MVIVNKYIHLSNDKLYILLHRGQKGASLARMMECRNAEGAYTTQVPGLPVRNSPLFNFAGLERTVSEHQKIAGEPRN